MYDELFFKDSNKIRFKVKTLSAKKNFTHLTFLNNHDSSFSFVFYYLLVLQLCLETNDPKDQGQIIE